MLSNTFAMLSNTIALLDPPASESPFQAVLAPVLSLIESALVPIIGLVATLGTIYCVFLGVKLAKAEEPQDREKAKNALKNAIIGFVLIFVLIVILRMAIGPMMAWMQSNVPTGEGGGGALSGSFITLSELKI